MAMTEKEQRGWLILVAVVVGIWILVKLVNRESPRPISSGQRQWTDRPLTPAEEEQLHRLELRRAVQDAKAEEYMQAIEEDARPWPR